MKKFAFAGVVSTVLLAVCSLSGGRSATPATPTYGKDIAPIINSQCVVCHHPGQVAPFSLTSYKDAQQHAGTMLAVVKSGYMPPWHADDPGLFCDERRLTPSQINTIQRWVDAGAPEGSPKAIPTPPQYHSDWLIGKPDAIFTPSQPYNLGASGNDVYRCFVIPTHYATDRWIKEIEIRPGNLHVVHHLIIYLDKDGEALKLQAATHDGKPGYIHFGGPGFPAVGTLGGWAPGSMPMVMPKGVGMLLPKGTDIVLQIHYHRDGKPEQDLTRVGVKFCNTPPKQKMRTAMLIHYNLNIPPGDKDYVVHSKFTIPANIHIFSVFPHMHLLGHTMNVTATFPDGKQTTLIDVPNWDFNWQGFYT